MRYLHDAVRNPDAIPTEARLWIGEILVDTSLMRVLRLLLELGLALGLLAAFAVGPFFLLLVWPAVVGTAVLDLFVSSLLFRKLRRRAARSGLSARMVLDTWLLAAPLAALCTIQSMVLEWPIQGESWDAHGYGMSGGEWNVAAFGPLHLLFWVGLLLAAGRITRARRCEEPSPT